MKRAVLQLFALAALGSFAMGTASGAILVSTSGVLGDANAVFEQQFTYLPDTMGGILTIQSYGFGGTANAPGGRNAAGVVIAPGGFDSIVALFSGAIGAGGARLASSDDGTCGAGMGTLDAGVCYDARLVLTGLPAGTYTVALTAYSNFPPATETGTYPGTGTFVMFGTQTVRSNAFALDVIATPEPVTMALFGSGLLAVGLIRRFRR